MRIYVLVALVAGVLSVGLYETYREANTIVEAGGASTDDLADPLWYREVSPVEAKQALRRRLDYMTSTDVPAKDTGRLKDEVALLLRHAGLVDAVVDSYRARRKISHVQVSAYMEIFARYRHPKFGQLVVEGIKEQQELARLNALDAAITQATPELVPYLSEILSKGKRDQDRRILSALVKIGTGEAFSVIGKTIRSQDAETAIQAMRSAADSGVVIAIPDIRTRLDDEQENVRVISAWALARLGQSEGRIRLRRLAADKSVSEGMRAQAIQCLRTVKDHGTVKLMQELETSEQHAVALEARVSGVWLGDPDAIRRVEKELADSETRLDAIQILGRTGRDEDVGRLREVLDSMTPFEVSVMLDSFGIGRANAAASLVATLARRDDQLGTQAITALHRHGDFGVEVLAELLENEDDVARRLLMINVLGSIRTHRSLAVLESLEAPKDRRTWRLHRENIRLVEQALIKE